MSAEGSTKAILAALLANAGIAVAKFVGFLITGSSSMLAESVHSVADTSAIKVCCCSVSAQSRKEPTALHQFGYGRSRYFYSFVVALVLFTLGSVFALYEGYHKISHPAELTSPIVAVVILVLQSSWSRYSFRTAMMESRPLKGPAAGGGSSALRATPSCRWCCSRIPARWSVWSFALAGVGLTVLTGNPVWDGVGTVGIGVLLGVIAVILMVEMHSLLIGEGPPREVPGDPVAHSSRRTTSTG